MYPTRLSPEELNVILGSINQAQARLRGMQLRQALLPMHYCARLAWEALYEARQILRSFQRPACGEAKSRFASMGDLSPVDIGAVTPSIEQVMAQLQAIETNTDLSAIQASVQYCLQQLNGVIQMLRQSMLALQS